MKGLFPHRNLKLDLKYHQICQKCGFKSLKLVRYTRSYNQNPFQNLSKTIDCQFEKDKQTAFDLKNKQELMGVLKTSILSTKTGKNYPDMKVWLQGSSVNGCGTKYSDVDVVVMLQKDLARGKYGAFYYQIKQYLIKNEIVDSDRTDIIAHARIPIFKFQAKKFSYDVSMNNDHGIRNSRLIYHFSKQDDRFSKLVYVIKEMAKKLKINNAFQKTLNSYSWTLLTVHFLQSGLEQPVLPKTQDLVDRNDLNNVDLENIDSVFKKIDFQSNNKQSVGELFFQWLVYYSRTFDFERCVISVYDGKIFWRNSYTDPQQLTLPLNLSQADFGYAENSDKLRILDIVYSQNNLINSQLEILDIDPWFEVKRGGTKRRRVGPQKNLWIVEPLEGYNSARAVKDAKIIKNPLINFLENFRKVYFDGNAGFDHFGASFYEPVSEDIKI